MLHQEQLNKLYEYIERPFCYARFGLENGIELETMQEVVDIEENAQDMNHSEWVDWYNKNKDNVSVILAGLNTKKVPRDIIHEIIEGLDIFSPTFKLEPVLSHKIAMLLGYSIINDIDIKDFTKVYDCIGRMAIHTLSANKFLSKELPEDLVRFIIDKTLQNFENKKPPYYIGSPIPELTEIKNENCLKEICNGEEINLPYNFNDAQKEIIRTAIINNRNISDEYRNQLFFAGCDWKKIKIFTPRMTEEVYQSCIDAFTNGYDKKKGRVVPSEKFNYESSITMLNKLLKNKMLPESMQYDLAQRIISRECKSMDEFTGDLFESSEHPEVLKLAVHLKSKDKEKAYNNPNMPLELIQKRAEDFCKKISKYLDKGQTEKIPNIWDEHIANCLYRCEIGDEHYETLKRYGGTLSSLAIMLSDKTPQNIKDDFYNYLIKIKDVKNNNAMFDVRLQVGYELYEFCKKENISDNILDSLKKYIKNGCQFTTRWDAYHSMCPRTHYQLSQIIRIIDDMVKDAENQDIEKIIKFCREKAKDSFEVKKQKTYEDKKENAYSFLTYALEDAQRDNLSKQKYNISHNPKDLTDNAFADILKEKLSDTRYDKLCFEYYKKIYENGDELYGLMEEDERRQEEKRQKEQNKEI